MGERGRPREHLTVEECRSAGAHELVRRCLEGGTDRGRDGDDLAYRVLLVEGRPAEMMLVYAVPGGEVGVTKASLYATEPRYGGLRWWFHCPGPTPGMPPRKECGRAAARLYLPPGGWRYACRGCHRLTYESRRWSGASEERLMLARFFGAVAAGDPRAVQALRGAMEGEPGRVPVVETIVVRRRKGPGPGGVGRRRG